MPRTVIVTGASSGIGAATARRLSADGWHVIAAARRSERLADLAAQIGDLGGSATAETVDVTSLPQVLDLVERAVEQTGSLDAFVANAGVMPLSRLDAGLVGEWDRMIDINVRGLLHGIAAALPVFTRQGSGHFVTLSSVGALQVSASAAVYCATKSAAQAITEGLRLESGPGIRVTTVTPGVVESELADSITDPDAAALMRTYRSSPIPATAIADAIAYALGQPQGIDVNEIVVRPSTQR